MRKEDEIGERGSKRKLRREEKRGMRGERKGEKKEWVKE